MKKYLFLTVSLFLAVSVSASSLIDQLVSAAEQGNIQETEQLLLQGADINGYSDLGLTPLTAAVIRNQVEMVNYLLEKGADPQLPTIAGIEPNMIARQRNYFTIHLLISDYILRKQGSVYTYLSVLIIKNDMEMVKMTLDSGYFTDTRDGEGATALMYAVFYGNRPAVDLLINSGADINAVDKDGISPIHIACITGDIELVKLLIAKGANVNSVDNLKRTPLIYAGALKNLDLISFLISKGADINARDIYGKSFLEQTVGDPQK